VPDTPSVEFTAWDRLQRHRIENDLVAPAILHAHSLGIGARIENLRMSGDWSTIAAAMMMGIRM
jgi:hypothetical protein